MREHFSLPSVRQARPPAPGHATHAGGSPASMTEFRELKSSSGRLGLLLSLAFVTSVLVLTGRIGAGREAADVLQRVSHRAARAALVPAGTAAFGLKPCTVCMMQAMYGFDSEQQVYAAPAESDQCTRASAAAALYEGGWQELTVPK